MTRHQSGSVITPEILQNLDGWEEDTDGFISVDQIEQLEIPF
ncbi:MAG: hypothetical protein ACLRH0_05290 [Blautia wexlerae]